MIFMDNEKETLYYDSLNIEGDYGPRNYYTGVGQKYINKNTAIDLEVDHWEVVDVLSDIVVNEDELSDEIDIDDNNSINNYVEAHYDELLDKYYSQVLSAFEDRAEEKAWTSFDEDYDTSLNELSWKHLFPKNVSKLLKLAVEKKDKTEEDYIQLLLALINCWQTLEKMLVLDSDEVEDYVEEVKSLSTTPNEDIKSWNTQFFDYDNYDYQDLEGALYELLGMLREWKKAVDSFYATCDYEGVLLLDLANKFNEKLYCGDANMLKEEKTNGKHYKNISDAMIWAWETYYKYENQFRDIFNKYGVEDIYDEKFYDLDNDTLNNIFKDMRRYFIKELNADNINWKKDEVIERFEITVRYEESLNTNNKNILKEDLIFNYTEKDKEILEELIKKEANPKKRRYLKNCLAKANYELTFNKLNESTTDGKLYLDKGIRELIALLKDTYDDEFIVSYLNNRIGMDEDDISKYTDIDKETIHIYLIKGKDWLKEARQHRKATSKSKVDETLHDTWTWEDEVAERESNDRYYNLEMKRDELDKKAIEKEVRKFANENDMDDGEFEYGDKLLIAYDPYNIYVDDISISKEYPTHLTSWEFKLDESLADDVDCAEFRKTHPPRSKKANPRFDRERYGKYFDKEGHLIPEMADEYMSMNDDEFDLDIDSMVEALSKPMEFNTEVNNNVNASNTGISPMLNELINQLPVTPNIPGFQNSMICQDSFTQVAAQQNTSTQVNYNTINTSGIPGMLYDDVCDIEIV